jgi:hypothetical protein
MIEKKVMMNYAFTKRDLVRCDYQASDTADMWARGFTNAIDDDEIIWCLISSNLDKWQNQILAPAAGTSPAVTAPPYELECYRYLKWRDTDGNWGGGPA